MQSIQPGVAYRSLFEIIMAEVGERWKRSFPEELTPEAQISPDELRRTDINALDNWRRIQENKSHGLQRKDASEQVARERSLR